MGLITNGKAGEAKENLEEALASTPTRRPPVPI